MREMNGVETEKRPGMGCVAKGLIGCAVFAVVGIVGGIAIGYYVILHTAVPAKIAAWALNKDPDIQIEGITGSLSKGFGVETIRYTDEEGNTNALDDIRLHYEKDGDTTVISEVHVGRGYFYVDRSKGEATFKDEGT